MSFVIYRLTRALFLLLLLLSALALLSAPAKERSSADDGKSRPFEPAEELVYEGEFSRSLLRGLNIAELRFRAERTRPQKTPPQKADATAQTKNAAEPSRLIFKGEAVSKGLLQKLFKVNFRQEVESTVDPDSFDVLQTARLDQQNNRLRTSQAVFDRAAGKVVWTERDPNNPAREPRVVTSEFKGQVQDIISAIYYLRTQPLTPGKDFSLNISDSGRVYSVPIHVLERKSMKSVLGEVRTIRVDAEVFGQNRLIEDRGSMSIWFTDDARHIPVRSRISSDTGTFDITLKSATTSTPR